MGIRYKAMYLYRVLSYGRMQGELFVGITCTLNSILMASPSSFALIANDDHAQRSVIKTPEEKEYED
jgi:hypothetical protein